jgi:hypothetical protein
LNTPDRLAALGGVFGATAEVGCDLPSGKTVLACDCDQRTFFTLKQSFCRVVEQHVAPGVILQPRNFSGNVRISSPIIHKGPII